MRPNHHTIGLLGLLVAMWYAGASQSNAAAYLLAFLTLSVACVSAVHAWSNLRGLTIMAEPIPPVYEGEPILVPVSARAQAGRRHTGVRLSGVGSKIFVMLDQVSGTSPRRTEVLTPAKARGSYRELPLLVQSTFPLGFFTARRLVLLPQEHFVYPKPDGALPLPVERKAQSQSQIGMQMEGDDFAGVREWTQGQSMRHVDWKAVARGQRLMVKQWSATATEPLALDWEEASHLDTEHRLRQLSRWIVMAECLESPYSLKMPGVEIPLSRGDLHFHRCMRALASFEEP